MSSSVLQLSQLEPFAIGGTRRCYVHPEDATRCIKVLRSDRTPQRRREQARGLRRLRGLRHWDDQLKEVNAYRELMQRHGSMLWKHVPEYFGTIETDMGIGIETKVFRDFDGRFPLNLEERVPRGTDQSLERAIDEFKVWLRAELVLTRNLLPHNIIAVRESEQSCRLVIVDGIGNSEWIPISGWIRAVARQKIERKIKRFEHRIRLLQDPDLSCDS